MDTKKVLDPRNHAAEKAGNLAPQPCARVGDALPQALDEVSTDLRHLSNRTGKSTHKSRDDLRHRPDHRGDDRREVCNQGDQQPDGKYRYFWLYKVKFGIPDTNLETKGDSITFQTPTIEGTVMRRNKPDALGRHPWKAEVTEGGAGVPAETITGWFGQVYEPAYAAQPPGGGE